MHGRLLTVTQQRLGSGPAARLHFKGEAVERRVVDTNGHKTVEFDPVAIKNRLSNEFENDCVSDIVTNQC